MVIDKNGVGQLVVVYSQWPVC